MDDHIQKIVSMLLHSLTLKKEIDTEKVLRAAVSYDLQLQHYDNLDGGTSYYSLVFYLDLEAFFALGDKKEKHACIASNILNEIYNDEQNIIQEIKFETPIVQYLDWKNISADIEKEDILTSLRNEMNMLIGVGSNKIIMRDTDADDKYQALYENNSLILTTLGLERSKSYPSLWDWYNFYKLPSYNNLGSPKNRYDYIYSIYNPLIEKISESNDSRKNLADYETINKLQETMSEVQNISMQAFHEFRRAIESFKAANENQDDERAIKDTVRSVASAMEAIIKVLGGTNDIKTSSKALRNAKIWGNDGIIKDGEVIFNQLHYIYPDLRHGSSEISAMSFEEAEYWIGRMTNYVSYIRKRKDRIDT